MRKNFDTILETALFRDVHEDSLEAMLKCLSPVYAEYPKNAYLWRQGEKVQSVGMVLVGSVFIQEEDFWGNRNILSYVGQGELFGEAYACLPSELLRVSVIASEDCEIMYLSVQRILTVCSSACEHHTRLIRNLLTVSAKKNLLLTMKLSHVSRKTTRDKLLSYLSSQSLAYGSASFDIPFNRQQLADYLGVERSAMCFELSKLRDEGMIQYNKNHFALKSMP